MSIKLGKHSFKGPFNSGDKLKDRAGLYAIVCQKDGEYFIVDVGESSKLKTHLDDQNKKDCWLKNCKGQLLIYVRYTAFFKQQRRIIIKQELRDLFDPACKIDIAPPKP